MMKRLFIPLLLFLTATFSPYVQQTPAQQSTPPSQETDAVTDDAAPQVSASEEKALMLSVNGNQLDVTWENNKTVDELIACAQGADIVVQTTLYGGFEQVGTLPQSFSRNDAQMTAVPGDIVLYSGNQLVLFFGSNSWSYTKLGHIEGLSEYELSELLGGNSAAVEIKWG